MEITKIVRWMRERNRTTCRRCGGPLLPRTGNGRWTLEVPTCERCDLRARWTASPGRRRI